MFSPCLKLLKQWNFICAQDVTSWTDISFCHTEMICQAVPFNLQRFDTFPIFKLAEHQLYRVTTILRNWSRVVCRAEGKSSLTTVTAVCWGYWTSANQRWLEVYLKKKKRENKISEMERKARQQKDHFLGAVPVFRPKISRWFCCVPSAIANKLISFFWTFAGR